jgi:hypothetical protein
MFTLTSLLSVTASNKDLARPVSVAAEALSASPNIWVAHNFLSQEAVTHMLSKIPKEESAYEPCIGQVDQFASKRCTFLPAKDDEIISAAIAKIGHTWQVDTSRLAKGLPIIRYLPGAPAVGKHGDMNEHGVVPNATLVLYLTDAEHESGQTIFPEAGVTVTPQSGSVLAFQNVDGTGRPHPKAEHLVGAVSKHATHDRLVVQIPMMHELGGAEPYAYPQHVSGMKAPGQHESMHGNQDQKAAYTAAIAAGVGIAVAYMAAKNSKWDPDLKQAYQTEAAAELKKDGTTKWFTEGQIADKDEVN